MSKNSTKKRITIIGAGKIGSAIGNLIKHDKTLINVWDRNPEKILLSLPLQERTLSVFVAVSDFIFLCVPSAAIRQVLKGIHLFKKNAIIVCLSKGIEADTNKTMDYLLEEILPQNQPYALLYGPMLAEELKNGQYGFGILAAKKHKTFGEVHVLFENTKLILNYSSDVHSTALAGVLKNVYSVALGIVEGLKLGDNTKGWLVAAAFQEMQRIIEQLGGDKEIVVQLSCLGDFIATGFSQYSRNRQVGYELVKRNRQLKSEGINAIDSLLVLLKEKGKDFLILQATSKIIKNEDAQAVFNDLINKKSNE